MEEKEFSCPSNSSRIFNRAPSLFSSFVTTSHPQMPAKMREFNDSGFFFWFPKIRWPKSENHFFFLIRVTYSSGVISCILASFSRFVEAIHLENSEVIFYSEDWMTSVVTRRMSPSCQRILLAKKLVGFWEEFSF